MRKSIFRFWLSLLLLPLCLQSKKWTVVIDGQEHKVSFIQYMWVLDPERPKPSLGAALEAGRIQKCDPADYVVTVNNSQGYWDDNRKLIKDGGAYAENLLKNAEAAALSAPTQDPELDGFQTLGSYFGRTVSLTSEELCQTFQSMINEAHNPHNLDRSGFFDGDISQPAVFNDLLNQAACVLNVGPNKKPVLCIFVPAPRHFYYESDVEDFCKQSFRESVSQVFATADALVEQASRAGALDHLTRQCLFDVPFEGRHDYAVSHHGLGLLELIRRAAAGEATLDSRSPNPEHVLQAIDRAKKQITRCIKGAVSIAAQHERKISSPHQGYFKRFDENSQEMNRLRDMYHRGQFWESRVNLNIIDVRVLCNFNRPHMVIAKYKNKWCCDASWEKGSIALENRHRERHHWTACAADLRGDLHGANGTPLKCKGQACYMTEKILDNTLLVQSEYVLTIDDLIDVVRSNGLASTHMTWKAAIEEAQSKKPKADMAAIMYAANAIQSNHEMDIFRKESRIDRAEAGQGLNVLIDVPVSRWRPVLGAPALTQVTDADAPPSNAAAAAAAAAPAEPPCQNEDPDPDALWDWKKETVQIPAAVLCKLVKDFWHLEDMKMVFASGQGSLTKSGKRPARR